MLHHYHIVRPSPYRDVRMKIGLPFTSRRSANKTFKKINNKHKDASIMRCKKNTCFGVTRQPNGNFVRKS